jgi:hypothetical protein
MINKDAVYKVAQYLDANDAPGTNASHIEYLETLYSGLANIADNRDTSRSVVDAVFNYVANHHAFELSSQEKAKVIIETVFEMVCPMAADTEESDALLNHLKEALKKRK